MKISKTGLELIKRYESFSGTAYICPAGKKTIGYGHTGQHVNDGVITEKRACEILDEDCNNAEDAVNHYVKVPLSQNQFDALVSLVFNIGAGAFKQSTLLRMLNDKYYIAAAEQFRRWVYSDKKKLDGLVTRRKAEEILFLKKEKAP